MDFVRSYLFTNATLTSCPLFSFCHHILVRATAKQQQTHPKVMTEWKKWATGQSCICKEVTSYKIHTLIQFTIPISIHLELTPCSFWWIKGLLGKRIPTSLWQKPGPGQESSAKWFFVFCRKKSRWWSVEFSVLLWFFFGLHTRTAHKENWFSMSSLTLVMSWS